ncbi:histone-lysine N-methyltransferase SETMAR [Trichonephila clavipes]|nr:histone-lysine N-methyltransferase SETMAR [Trichonephila clavipes]
MITEVKGLVLNNHRITVDKIHRLLGIRVGTTHTIRYQHLNFQKICAQWVPRQLTVEQHNTRMALSLSHLQRYHEENMAFSLSVGNCHWCRNRWSGRGSLGVKVTGSWLACHEMEPSTTEDLPCRGGRCTLNMWRLKCPPLGVVWKLGEGGASSGVVLTT